ncbi:efflux RND transporter permease subunit [Sphingomonas sp. CGMCC 1.13654]|uniref:Efflux RND transporter permease subunit n=1 Tax=Sphingomonas chungangi TaxID=2683589 RepID=A0A838LB36_9SPHN|nr:efflux RND transporter permease subunit [Sphingomonas chungangi]MBA2936461.1 efflux RND transporter permease subunit [Sphingomonas chungangi]MVW55846.1 MMPL family transporter [Sphingomonas chungangi]
MNLSAPFIRRPIATILLTIGLALSGIAGFFSLPVAPLPQVDFPTISVSASLSGASPEVMAQSIATPLERRLSTIAGVTEMTSQSSLGSTRITLQFDLSKDIDGAAREVEAAINASRVDLPATLKQNPTYNKVNPANQPVVTLALTSDTMTAGQIYDAVSNVVQQRISQVQGVGQVEVGGGSLPAVRVDIDPYRLNSYGIAMEDVRAAIEAANANRPKGLLQAPDGRAWQIYTNAAGRYAADYRSLVIAWRNNAPVRLGDVADVTDSVADTHTMGLYNGKRAIIVNITQQPGANLIQMVDAIRAELPLMQEQLPADIKINVAMDRTSSIRASIREIEITVYIALALVVIVVFAFLRDVRSTMIPAIATIVSLLGTFGVMYLLGFSLNNLSLMAITVATGFVVDDAIVVLENTTRHLEQGMGRFEAALQGAREVGFTVLSISVSLVAVFIPLLFMGGIIGRLFREFAVTLSVSVLISLVLSLTMTPMLCAWFLRTEKKGPPGRISRTLERGYGFAERCYAASLDWALAMKPLVLVLLAVVIALTAYLYVVVPKGFFPQQQSPLVMAGVRADESVSFQSMQDKLQTIVKIIKGDRAVQSVVGFTGGSRAGGAFIMISLKPVGQRHGLTSADVIQRLQRKLQPVAGIRLFLSPVQDLRIGGRQGNSTYQYTLMADNVVDLQKWAQKLNDALVDSKVVTNVDSDLAENGVESFVTIDKDAASRLGISPLDVDNALYDAFGQRSAATIYEDINQYSVILGWRPAATTGPQNLPDVRIPADAVAADAAAQAANTSASGASSAVASPVATQTTSSTGASSTGTSTSGTTTAVPTNPALRDPSTGSALSTSAHNMVPLPTIATFSQAPTAASVNHQGTELAATISFDLQPGKALSDAQTEIASAEARIGLPNNIHGTFAGTAQAFQQSQGSQPLLILAALVTIYIVLGMLYENLIHPITVLSTLPAAGVGAVLALMILGMQFDIIALIGLFLLLGIVKKNAILIIDFALEAQRARGLTAEQAAREASLLRFRPILMTTLAAALGALPLAIGFGEGAELRRPLGVAIVGGLIASQVLTLITTPVVYVCLDKLAHRKGRQRRRPLREIRV